MLRTRLPIQHIRRGLFETNSSSTHALVIMKDSHLINYELELSVVTGDFGWERALYCDSYDKLSYLLTYCVYLSDLKFFDILKTTFPEVVFKADKINGMLIDSSEDCYIDHGGELDIDLFSNNPTILRNFVLNPANFIQTGNDNSDEPYVCSDLYPDAKYVIEKRN